MNKASVTLDVGVDKTDIKFIQHLEKEIDSVMVKNGFTRTTTTKKGDSTEFNYRQFGVVL